MSQLILTPILAFTLFFFAQTNNQRLYSLPEVPVKQEVEAVNTEQIKISINSEWLTVIGLTGFVSLMWFAVLHCNRPKTLIEENYRDFEEESYFG